MEARDPSGYCARTQDARAVIVYWNLLAAFAFYLAAAVTYGTTSDLTMTGLWFALGAAFTAQALRRIPPRETPPPKPRDGG
jgi:hypothetical protein